MRQVKRIRFFSLWAMFAAIIFFVLLLTALLIMLVAFLLYRFGHLTEQSSGSPLDPIGFLMLLSVIVGTILFLFVGRIILKPVTRFSEATKDVAKGDFTIRIEEMSRIKEVQEMARNFNLMVQELSSIETLRTDFVVNVSHEFKTPLAAIEGYATLLQNRELSHSERDEYARMIIDSSRQLATLTGNILSLTKLENQEVVIDKKQFRLDEQIREAILLLENRWNDKDIQLIIELEKVNYYGSINLLRQIWMNLIDNAIKFTPAHGSIEIRLFSGKETVVAVIKDDGRGIDPADMKHIFDKFYQADKARGDTGNGLGLALVKRIVDLCQGSIQVESESGKGSQFTVTLPDKP